MKEAEPVQVPRCPHCRRPLSHGKDGWECRACLAILEGRVAR